MNAIRGRGGSSIRQSGYLSIWRSSPLSAVYVEGHSLRTKSHVARRRRASRSIHDLCHMLTAVFAECILSDQGQLRRALPSILARDCSYSKTSELGQRAQNLLLLRANSAVLWSQYSVVACSQAGHFSVCFCSNATQSFCLDDLCRTTAPLPTLNSDRIRRRVSVGAMFLFYLCSVLSCID